MSAHATRRVTLRRPGVRLWVCSTNINNFKEHSGEARGRVARGTHGGRWSPWGFLFLQRDEVEVASLASWAGHLWTWEQCVLGGFVTAIGLVSDAGGWVTKEQQLAPLENGPD